MEENTDGTKKTTPSIPANYISILQLQERWINEKERKRKEEEEKKIEEDLKKAEEAKRQREEEKRLDRSNRKHWGRNSRQKELRDGGEARFAEKEEPEVTAAIGSGGGEDTAEGLPVKNRGFRRKRYDSKKKKNEDVAVVEDVVDCGCGSIAPPPESNTPVKDVNRVYRKKGGKATGKKSVGSREKAVTDDATAIETHFENLSIKNLKAQIRSSNRNQLNQRHDVAHQRVRMPTGTASTMVWVKKEQNERAGDGIGSGVKPLNA